MSKHNAPIVRERHTPGDGDPVHSFLRSRAARIGAAATGAALLATRLTGLAAAYDDGGGAKWTAHGDQGGSYWFDVDDKKSDNKKSNNNQRKNDDRSNSGQKQAERPTQPAQPQKANNNRDRDDDSGERKRNEERQRHAENEARKQAEHDKQQQQEEARKQAAREWAAKVEAEKQRQLGAAKHVGNTQGKSPSNPDGGGADAPFAKRDAPANTQGDDDRDGNNGGGNDDDCSDDNNGNGPANCDVVAGEQAKKDYDKGKKDDLTQNVVDRNGDKVVKNDDDTCVIVVDGQVNVRDDYHKNKFRNRNHNVNNNLDDDTKSPTGGTKSHTGSPTTSPGTVAGVQVTPTPTPDKAHVAKDDDDCTDDAGTGDSSPSANTNGTNTSRSGGSGGTNCVVVNPTATAAATEVPTIVAGDQATPSPTITPDDGEKTISAKALIQHACIESEWHFIINGLKAGMSAPSSITVTWANGATATVPLEKTSGENVAHYTTTANLDSPVVNASANIDAAWDGNFNLSHGPCIEDVAGVQTTPTPTNASTPTDTPVNTTTTGQPTVTPTNTPVPTAVAGEQATPTDDDTTHDTNGTTAGTTANTTVQGGNNDGGPSTTSGTNAEGTQSGGGTVGGTLADVQPGDIDQPTAGRIAEVIGGGVQSSDIQQMGGAEIAALAEAAGVPVAEVEAVLGESVTRDAPGEAFIEDVLGTQARQGYENVVAGAMASTGGAPVGPLALGLAALGGVGVALRRFTRRSM